MSYKTTTTQNEHPQKVDDKYIRLNDEYDIFWSAKQLVSYLENRRLNVKEPLHQQRNRPPLLKQFK